MATQNLIQIKRSETTATPTSLANGELAWSGLSDALFIGNFGAVSQIGGLVIDSDTMSGANATNIASAESIKAYVDSVAGAGVSDLNDVSDVNAGSATGGHVLTWDATESKWVDADIAGGTGISSSYDQATDEHTISLDDTAVTDGAYGSASAVATFTVDAQGRLTAAGSTNIAISSGAVSGLATSATTDTTNASNITSGTLPSAQLPDLAVSDFGGAAIVIESEGIDSSDNDTSIPTSASVKDFVEGKGYSTTTGTVTSVSSGNGLTGGPITGSGSLAVQAANNTISVGAGGIAVIESNLSITESQISDLGSYLTAETNDLTSAVTWANVPDANITESSVTQHEAALSITASQISDDIALGTDTSGNYVATIAGTANEISVSGSGSETAAVTIGLPDDVTIGQDLTVTGNLVVQGTTTTIDTTQLLVEDNLIRLATNNSADTTDFGVYGVYNDGTDKYAGIVRDASDSGTFKLLEGITTEPTGTTVTGGTLAALDVGALSAGAITASSLSLTNDLAVTHGGTGKSSVTTNAVVYGQGTSALAEATGSAYDVLRLNASGVPEFGSLDGGDF